MEQYIYRAVLFEVFTISGNMSLSYQAIEHRIPYNANIYKCEVS